MKKKFCVIGLGNFGRQVASTLYENGHEVVVIDSDKDKVQAIKNKCSYVIMGDASDKEFLDVQDLREMDAVVVSTGERSHLSTLITLYLKELKVPRILVKANNEDHGRILKKVGASEVIFPEKDMAIKVAHSLSSSNIIDFIPLAEEYTLTETAPPKHFIGKTLLELDLRKKFNLTVIAIKDVLRDQFIAVPPPEHLIKDSDALIIIGKKDDVNKVLET